MGFKLDERGSGEEKRMRDRESLLHEWPEVLVGLQDCWCQHNSREQDGKTSGSHERSLDRST